MEISKLKDNMETKDNGEPQLTIVEIGDINYCTNTRPSIPSENKKSG